MAVKGIVLGFGSGEFTTLLEAVIADVRAALLAILNAVRIHKMTVEKRGFPIVFQL